MCGYTELFEKLRVFCEFFLSVNNQIGWLVLKINAFFWKIKGSFTVGTLNNFTPISSIFSSKVDVAILYIFVIFNQNICLGY